MKKYSIVFPYIDRIDQFRNTLKSLVSMYGRSDFEVVVVEDNKNADSHELANLIQTFRAWIDIIYLTYHGINTNPSPLYNYGVTQSFGRFVVLSSPECVHKTDVLKGFDGEFDKNKDVYVVAACQSLDAQDRPIKWFQHSVHRNVLYHFCSAMSRDNYERIGGFDEGFANGYCFDDDDFKQSVINLGIEIVARDDLIVGHQCHKKTYHRSRQMWLKNKKLYESKHGKYEESLAPKPIYIIEGATK